MFVSWYFRPGFGDFDTFCKQIFREGRTLLGMPFPAGSAALSHPQGEQHSPAKNTCVIEGKDPQPGVRYPGAHLYLGVGCAAQPREGSTPGMTQGAAVVTLAFCWLKIHFI